MSLKNIYPEKIPKEMLEMNYIDDIILYSLGAYGPLQKAEFDKINKTTFYKYLNSLIEKGFLFPPKRKRRIAIYEITPSGQAELIRRLGKYNLDFYELIELEKKKITAQVSQLSSFFEKYLISDDQIKIDFLYLYNKLIHDKSLSLFSEEQFNILIFYIILNDVKFFKKVENVLTIKEFIDKIDVENLLTKTDMMMFIQEVVDKNRYGINIFKIPLIKEEKFLFFGEDSEIGIIFETIIKKYLRNLNYLKSLNNSEIYLSDLEDIMKPILYDLIKKYKVFSKEIEQEIHHLVEDYITDLQLEPHEKPFIEIEKISEYFSLYSPYVGFTYPFEPLSEKDELELTDMYTTFKRIREKEPKNKLLSETSTYLYDNKLEQALIEINKYLKIDPKDSEALEMKSEILFKLGNFEKALELFEEAQQFNLNPKHFWYNISTNTTRAELHLALKRYNEALDIVKKVIPEIIRDGKEFDEIKFIEEDYFSFPFLKLEATIHFEQGNFNEALEAINKDLEYMERFIGMDEGRLILESYSLKSKILNKLKRYEESLNNLEKSLTVKPEDPELNFQSAELTLTIYPMRCFFYLSKALDQEPNNEKYQKLYEQLLSHYSHVGFLGDFYYTAAKEMIKLFNEHQGGLTLELLKKELFNSEVLKNMRLFEEDELLQLIGFIIKMTLENEVIISKNDVYRHNSNGMQIFLDKLKTARYSVIMENNFLLILDAYKRKNWGKISKNNLISKITDKMTDLIPDETIKAISLSLIENLLEKELLNRSKGNLIEINKDFFEKAVVKLIDAIREEEISKNLSLL